jgi:low affinity Fe/Cu permease
MKLVTVETKRHPFVAFARWVASASGRPITFALALCIVLTWLLTGSYFHYSDTWQLVINTGTTIITFLMVFLIQNTQNRDSIAMQVKLDELIRSTTGAHNALLDLEHMSEDELITIKNKYEQLAREAREALRKGKSDMGSPKV